MQPLKSFFNRNKLAFVLALAILIALSLTFISMVIYIRTGVASLDLSRPGYEAARDQINVRPEKSQFDDSGPVNKQALEEFDRLYQVEITDQKALDTFDNKNLEDVNLRFTPEP